MTTPARFRVPGDRRAHVTAREGDRRATGALLVHVSEYGLYALCGINASRTQALTATPTDPTCPACERTAR